MCSPRQQISGKRGGRSRRTTALITLIALATSTGCGPRRTTNDYVPTASQARQAVEQMLAAWRRGETTKSEFQLSENGPRVQVFDKQWTSGKKLTASEVLRELPAEPNGPRQIAVKLIFDGDAGEVEATYFVVGIDPLLIFRDTEYRQASGMK